ncbi:MAG: Gfo/Idh/MocA family protein, partial [Mahellales bacterium]
VAAAKNGKHVLCEKPLAMTYKEAELMYNAARENGIKHMVNFNYRRIPAVALAKDLVDSGQLGEIYHFKAIYQQDWAADPQTPYVWRFDKKMAGAGSMADKGSHIIDLARFLVGEITEVAGVSDIFIKERPSLDGTGTKQEVTTDDAAMFITRFNNGAMGIFETSRISVGYKNALQFEINGSKGCVRFNLERLNELEAYFSDDNKKFQGFRNIMVTEPEHEYIDRWWPPGHIIGWEHTFIHQYYEFIKAIVQDYLPQPNFYDGMKNQQVIEAVERAVQERTWVSV